MSHCLHCHQPISAGDGFYEITHQPAGHMWRVCSLECLMAFVRGGDEPQTLAEHTAAAIERILGA